MTLTTSRISDEFALIQEIMAKAPGFCTRFNLYPNLQLEIGQDGLIAWFETRGERVINAGCDTTRNVARRILNRYW